jgi:DNA-binding LacI/PurR family transcriptional regulator
LTGGREFQTHLIDQMSAEPSLGPTRRAELGLLAWLQRHRREGAVRLPSERALAAELGVSFYAVNRAVGEMVARGLLRREGYKLYPGRWDHPASGPLTVGALRVTEFHSLGVAELAEQARARVLWGNCIDHSAALRELRRLAQAGIDGLLFWPPGLSRELERELRTLEDRGIPVVLVNNTEAGYHTVDWSFWNTVRLALDHFVELGHREVALAHGIGVKEQRDAWRGMCLARGLVSSAARTCELPGGDDVRRAKLLLGLLQGEWRECTALFSTIPSMAAPLLRLLRESGRRVPQEVSLITMGDTPATRTSSPPITSIAGDHRMINRTAWDLLMRLVAEQRQGRRRPDRHRLRLELDLKVRSSTGPVPGGEAPAGWKARGERTGDRQLRWSADDRQRREEVEQINNRAYTAVKGLALRDFSPLDLRAVLNRPLGYRRGWLGDQPLDHLSTGVRVFHGVPFEIRGGPQRNDFGVLVLRSRHSHVAGGQEAPRAVELILPPSCRAVYFLHACAFGRASQVFARYRFIYGDGKEVAVPLRPLGDGVTSVAEDDGSEPNLQDWWPDLPQQDFPHAHRVVVTEHGDPTLYERYLYTLEWLNPRPRARLQQLRIETEPDAETTLGVLAVTAVPS